jgi:predicted aspartyl protease
MAGKTPLKAIARGALALLAMAVAAPAGASPRPAPAEGAAVEQGWIAFTPAPGGTILFDMSLNGQPVRALLDTGATRSIVSTALAQRLGLPLQASHIVSATGGPVSLAAAGGIRLQVGPVVATDMVINVADLAALVASLGAQFDVVLGMDVLGRRALDIDFAAHRFLLAASGLDLPGATPFPLRFSTPNRIVHWIEAPLTNSAPMRLHIDTGSDGYLELTPAAAARLDRQGVRSTTLASRGLAGLAIEELITLPRLTLGPLPLSDVPITIEAPGGFIASRRVDGLIGMPMLSGFHSVIDFPAGRVLLLANPSSMPPAPRSTAGLQFDYHDATLEVIHVMANSPAAAAGWRPGDCIRAVDGVAVADVRRDRRTAGWSRGAPGRIVTLTMCDGSTRSLTLARFY